MPDKVKYKLEIVCPTVGFDAIYRTNIDTGLKYLYKQIQGLRQHIDSRNLRPSIKVVISAPEARQSDYFLRKNFTVYKAIREITYAELEQLVNQ